MSNFSLFTQENCLSLLSFSKEHATFVRGMVTPKLFTPPHYRTISEKIIGYIDRYKEPPCEHIADLLEDELIGPENEQYREILNSLFQIKVPNNPEYIIDQVKEFVIDKQFTTSLVEAYNLYQLGEKSKAKEMMQGALSLDLSLFDPGIGLTDIEMIFEHDELDYLPTGISAFDMHGVAPAKKRLYLYIAPYGTGKSWHMIHLAKMGVLVDWNVVYITLEMPKGEILQRMIQSIFSINQYRTFDHVFSKIFTRDGNGDVIGFSNHPLERPSLEDPNIKEFIYTKLGDLRGRQNNLRIAEFPSGFLTLPQLTSYLDRLENTQNFIPDLVILDYLDLMSIRGDYIREDTGRLLVNLRGLAMMRNFALATASQVNRDGAGAKLIQGINVAEDFSKTFTSDRIVSYNQTLAEHKMGLARLFVDKNRSGKDKFLVLVSQNYEIGQFVLDSNIIPNQYNADKGAIDNG